MPSNMPKHEKFTNYETQERPPKEYSKYRPSNKIKTKEKHAEKVYKEGTNKANSTSKTRKIIAIKKNFIQKGT